MKRLMQWSVAFVLLGSLTIEAEPIIDWIFQQSFYYENGFPRDADDTWEWTLHCNDAVDEQDPPYEMDFALFAGPDSINDVDMGPLVAVGGMGTYWCGMSTYSQKWRSQSAYASIEKDFTVTAQSTGYVPVRPTW